MGNPICRRCGRVEDMHVNCSQGHRRYRHGPLLASHLHQPQAEIPGQDQGSTTTVTPNSTAASSTTATESSTTNGTTSSSSAAESSPNSTNSSETQNNENVEEQASQNANQVSLISIITFRSGLTNNAGCER